MKRQNPSLKIFLKFYNKKEPLYLETDLLGIGLGAGLLPSEGQNVVTKNDVPDKVALHPTVFDIKV